MPKEVKFFDLFDAQAHLVMESASLFKKIVCTPEITRDNVSKMHSLEHDGDEACHSIINTLNESFITPFDREDILDLTNQMDNIIDGIYLITNRFYLFKIFEPSQESKHLAEIIEKSAIEVHHAVMSLRSKKNFKQTSKHCVEINRLENLADDIRDEAISRILNDEKVNLVFAALLSACLWNLITWWFGLPVSTTHIITGGIVGAGMFKRFSAVHWGVARRIVWAWVITMPAAGAIAALSYFLKTL